MVKRLIHHYAIVGRREGPFGIVAPDDFQLVLRAVSDVPTLPRGALAYCADLSRERVLFTCHAADDLPAIFGGPFLFIEQLRRAGSILSVPCERLEELELGSPPPMPAFIFSAGRAGSTLLARLLTASGLACASEPDMLTQMVCLSDADRLPRPPGMDVAMAGACIAAIGRVLGQGAFLKLRSQCNANPLLLLGACGSGRVIFLLRKAASWALSRSRAFDEGPAHIAGLLGETLDALHRVECAGIAAEVIWYETLSQNPLAVLKVCAPHMEFSKAAIAAVMARDSQSGTILARDRVRPADQAESFFSVFEPAWRERCRRARWAPCPRGATP